MMSMGMRNSGRIIAFCAAAFSLIGAMNESAAPNPMRNEGCWFCAWRFVCMMIAESSAMMAILLFMMYENRE